METIWSHSTDPQLTGIEDADVLGAVSKQDILSLFLTRVHPSSKTRSKLSIHLQSQTPQPKHVSHAAAYAFAQIAHEKGFNLEEVDWSSSLYADGEPSEIQFATFWRDTLTEGSTGAVEKIFAALPQLTERFPAEKDATGSLKEDVIHIKDISAFRKSLRVSEPPKPLVDWNDLPIARF
jgi:insulysin